MKQENVTMNKNDWWRQRGRERESLPEKKARKYRKKWHLARMALLKYTAIAISLIFCDFFETFRLIKFFLLPQNWYCSVWWFYYHGHCSEKFRCYKLYLRHAMFQTDCNLFWRWTCNIKWVFFITTNIFDSFPLFSTFIILQLCCCSSDQYIKLR